MIIISAIIFISEIYVFELWKQGELSGQCMHRIDTINYLQKFNIYLQFQSKIDIKMIVIVAYLPSIRHYRRTDVFQIPG